MEQNSTTSSKKRAFLSALVMEIKPMARVYIMLLSIATVAFFAIMFLHDATAPATWQRLSSYLLIEMSSFALLYFIYAGLFNILRFYWPVFGRRKDKAANIASGQKIAGKIFLSETDPDQLSAVRLVKKQQPILMDIARFRITTYNNKFARVIYTTQDNLARILVVNNKIDNTEIHEESIDVPLQELKEWIITPNCNLDRLVEMLPFVKIGRQSVKQNETEWAFCLKFSFDNKQGLIHSVMATRITLSKLISLYAVWTGLPTEYITELVNLKYNLTDLVD